MANLLPWQMPVKLGTPFHGEISDTGGGLAIHLPNDSTLDYPHSIGNNQTPIKVQAPAAPATSTTPEETAAGMEWRNYVLWQYGRTDFYHQNNITSGSTDSEVLAEWFYMPVFGKRFTLRLVGPGLLYPGSEKTYTISVVGGEVIHTMVRSAKSLAIADICDGAGDKVMLLETDDGTGKSLSVIELALSFNAETDEISLVENLIDGVASTNSSDSTFDRIRKYSYETTTTEIGSYTCNNGGAEDITVPLHQTVRTPFLIPLTEPDSAAYETLVLNVGFRYIGDSTFTQEIDELLGAIYQDGVGKSVRMLISVNNATTETVERVIEGQSHEVEAPPCGSWETIIDTPFVFDAQFVTDTSNSTTSQLIVGGTMVEETISTFTNHQSKYYADGFIEAATVDGDPLTGWDEESSSSSGSDLSISRVSGVHPMWTVRTAPGDACSILHTYGLTSGFNRLNPHALDHAGANASERSYTHSWV
jgi:hypothetical protein